jgi:hypothetical protein
MIATFDPTAYKTTTRAQWDDAAGAWHAWGPTLEDWLGEATTLMLDAAGIHIGSAVLDVAAGAGGQTLDAARRVRQSPETVETRDWSFWILSRCRSCPGFRSLPGAAPAVGVKARPQARPLGLGLDPGEDAAILESRKPTGHAACSSRACS